jgi:hypothetical protein
MTEQAARGAPAGLTEQSWAARQHDCLGSRRIRRIGIAAEGQLDGAERPPGKRRRRKGDVIGRPRHVHL